MKQFFALVAILAVGALALSACGGSHPSTTDTTGQAALNQQQAVSNDAIARVQRQEPAPVLYDSSDARNQRYFYTIQSDPNKIEYLELVALDGSPYAHFTIRGQVSSMNTQETNPFQSTCKYTRSGDQSADGIACTSIAQADPNGVYQGADNGHFAFTTSGAVIEWEGSFLTSDEPFTIQTPVKLQLNESVAPTPTNTSHVSGGILPTRTP